jgi:hypothetical protein
MKPITAAERSRRKADGIHGKWKGKGKGREYYCIL